MNPTEHVEIEGSIHESQTCIKVTNLPTSQIISKAQSVTSLKAAAIIEKDFSQTEQEIKMLQKKSSKEELMTIPDSQKPYKEKREFTNWVDLDGNKLVSWYTTLPQPMDMSLVDVQVV